MFQYVFIIAGNVDIACDAYDAPELYDATRAHAHRMTDGRRDQRSRAPVLVGWDGVGWDGMGVGWDGVGWDGMGWDGVGWDGMGWSGVGWDGVEWCVGWDGIACRTTFTSRLHEMDIG